MSKNDNRDCMKWNDNITDCHRTRRMDQQEKREKEQEEQKKRTNEQKEKQCVKEKEAQEEAQEKRAADQEEIKETGTLHLENGEERHRIQLLTIIGEIEGHEAVSGNTKATKYEHLLPKQIGRAHV